MSFWTRGSEATKLSLTKQAVRSNFVSWEIETCGNAYLTRHKALWSLKKLLPRSGILPGEWAHLPSSRCLRSSLRVGRIYCSRKTKYFPLQVRHRMSACAAHEDSLVNRAAKWRLLGGSERGRERSVTTRTQSLKEIHKSCVYFRDFPLITQNGNPCSFCFLCFCR